MGARIYGGAALWVVTPCPPFAPQLRLMRAMRDSIVERRFPAFVRDFMRRRYGTNPPSWAQEALRSVGIELSGGGGDP